MIKDEMHTPKLVELLKLVCYIKLTILNHFHITHAYKFVKLQVAVQGKIT